MHYQDHHNKLSFLCSLSSKEAREVAIRLIEIFTLIGAPFVLQMNNGREFVARVIKELKKIWKEMVIVHGRPRHPQSQGSVERANADIKNMLSLWMKDNKSTNWSLGLKFFQMAKNNSYHRIIKCTPYFATFGKEMNYGAGISSIPKDLLTHINTEEELEQLLKNNTVNNSPEHLQNIEEIEDLLINPTTSQAVNVDDNEHDEDFIEDENDYDEEIEDSVNEKEIEEMIEEVINDKILKNVSEEIISSLLDSVISEFSFQAKRGRKRRIELDKENDEILPISTSKHPCFQSNAIKIQDIQNDCHEYLKNAADLMAKQHIHKLGEAKIGDTVQVTVPDVDRGPADPVNILAYVTKINNHQLYQLAT